MNMSSFNCKELDSAKIEIAALCDYSHSVLSLQESSVCFLTVCLYWVASILILMVLVCPLRTLLNSYILGDLMGELELCGKGH